VLREPRAEVRSLIVLFDRLSRWEAIGASVEGKKELVDLMAWAT
jgi:hypothetical protein